jgi:hypothetical protein
MNRTVQIAGDTIVTHKLGQPMDDAFDHLYRAFEQGRLAVDDNFKAAALHYFDRFVNSIHAPAAHDEYFNCFTPIWKSLLPGVPDVAEKVWELAFDPVQQWEQANPGKLIDKGTLCYFWGATALLRGNLDRGYLLIHQSVEEDSRTSGLQIPPTPSYALVGLDYEKPDRLRAH